MILLKPSSYSAMAAAALASPLPSNSRHSLSRNPNFILCRNPMKLLTRHTRPSYIKLSLPNFDPKQSTNLQRDNDLILSPPSADKKSFAVATGELFLGIASRLIRRGKQANPENSTLKDDSVPLMLNSDNKVLVGERIASVVEDSLALEVVWEQRVKDVEAEKRRNAIRSPGFSFSAAGLLFPYHLGVAQFLIEKGYIKDTTPLAGSSAGAIACAVIASGSSMHDALYVAKMLAEDCRLRGTAFRLGAVLRDVLDKFFPDDIHIRCSGRVRVAVTQILWRPRGLLIDQFDSKEDVINAVFTSSFIPGYLAPRPATMFRNRLCIDGGLTLFMPPTSAAQTVRVCAFPASQLRFQEIGINPDCNPENRHGPRQLLNWALEPAEDYVLDKLFEFGYLDAEVWAEENPIEEIVQECGH
ncbi:hypothetical protein Nepgr_026329 [Nepenthes gracilis]|uniref:Patatin n=1 Tax=Nepenthes gracilis TaxID=150966 RepID=A0AAD3T9H0_NEPGR|nr:hypothetical protein Nepgr_026329 [Nepenthes gracilis]